MANATPRMTRLKRWNPLSVQSQAQEHESKSETGMGLSNLAGTDATDAAVLKTRAKGKGPNAISGIWTTLQRSGRWLVRLLNRGHSRQAAPDKGVETGQSVQEDLHSSGKSEIDSVDIDIWSYCEADILPILMSDSSDNDQGLRERVHRAIEEMQASILTKWKHSNDARSAFRAFSGARDAFTSQFARLASSNMSDENISPIYLRFLYINLFAFAEMGYFEERSLVYAREFLKRNKQYARGALPGRRLFQFDAVAHYILAKTFEGLGRPREGVRQAQQALDLYLEDDQRLLDFRQSVDNPSESMTSNKVEFGQLWHGTPGFGCIISCYDLLATLYIKSRKYRDAWKQHDQLLAMSGPDYQAQEKWRQSRNGTPIVAFSRAWRTASKLYSAKRDFVGARASLELVIAQTMQQEQFDLIGEAHEFLDCAEQLCVLIHFKFIEDVENGEEYIGDEETELILGKHLSDCSIIDGFVEEHEMHDDPIEGPVNFPSHPNLAKLLSLGSPASLQAFLKSRRSNIRWWRW